MLNGSFGNNLAIFRRTAAYWLLLHHFWPSIVRFLYAGKYMEVAGLVPLVAFRQLLGSLLLFKPPP